MRYQKYLRRYFKLRLHQLRLSLFTPAHFRRHLPAMLVVLVLFGFTLLISWVPTSFIPHLSPPSIKSVSPSPSPLSSRPPPDTSARNIFIEDLSSGLVLYQKSADEEIYPASTTKIVTALVVLDSFPLDQIITVSRPYPEGEHIGFQPGEKLTVEKLLYALLVQSANDAAEILAENFAGGRAAFIAAMNTKVTQLGLKHTYFKNPTGLDQDGHYSSASDLGRLTAFALNTPLFARIVSTQNAIISSSISTAPRVLTNTNELLGKIPGVLGVKTGFTDKAGQSLISLINRNNDPLLLVVLGSTDRFGDSEKLIDWAYSPGPTLPPAHSR